VTSARHDERHPGRSVAESRDPSPNEGAALRAALFLWCAYGAPLIALSDETTDARARCGATMIVARITIASYFARSMQANYLARPLLYLERDPS